MMYHNNRDSDVLEILSTSTLLYPWCIVDSELNLLNANTPLYNYIGNNYKGKHILHIFHSAKLELQVQSCMKNNTHKNIKHIRILNTIWDVSITPKQDLNICLITLLPNDDDTLARDAQQEEFMQNIVHELRSPLTSIIGFAELLDTTDKSEVNKDKIRYILKQGKRMQDILNALLYLAYPQHQITEKSDNNNMSNIIIECINIISPTAAHPSITFTPPAQAIYTNIDTRLISIVIHNIIDNAIKYGNMIIPIVVTLAAHPQDNTMILTVQDSGIEIPQHLQEKIFEKFYRIKYDNKDKAYGTGLGLAIAKKIVTLHHGTIKVLNEKENHKEKKGSTFIIQLPMVSNP